MDVVRGYAVFNPDHDVTPRWYEMLAEASDCGGMQREGLRFSVPVHRESASWAVPRETTGSARIPAFWCKRQP